MKRVLVFILMAGLGFLLAWALSKDSSQRQAELENVKAELQQLKPDMEKTESEKSELQIKLALAEQECKNLREQVKELTDSRDDLKRKVEKFTFSSDQSRQQLAEIIDEREKLKQRLADLTDSQNKLLLQLQTLNTSRNQLRMQVKELVGARDAAIAKARAAQERIEMLLALVDSETKKSNEQQDKNGITVTTQKKEDTQSPLIKTDENPVVLTKVDSPAVVSNNIGKLPVCESFNSVRPQIIPGQSLTLSWQVLNADQIRIEPGIGMVSALGSIVVKPAATTTYTLIAINKAGESRATCKVQVGEKPNFQNQTVAEPVVFPEVIEPLIIKSTDNKLQGESNERITTSDANFVHPRILLEQYKPVDNDEVLTEQEPRQSEPDSTVRKFLGYRARKDESGKFIFIPVFEKKQEK